MEMKEKIVIGNKTFAYVRVKDLKISKYNMRPEQTPEEKEIIKEELAKSIKELGLQQLPVIIPTGEVFIGGRRTVAFQILGEEWMLAEIRDANPLEQFLASYSENYHRKSPDWLNDGKKFLQIMKETGCSERELAKKLDISYETIASKVRSYKALHSVNGVDSISIEQARMIASIPETDKQAELVKTVSEGMPTKDLKRIIGTTNAVKALLDGETDEVKKKAETKYKDLYYKKELKIQDVAWDCAEWSGDSHATREGRIWWDEHDIKSTKEAIEWFKKYGGRHLSDLEGSEGEWDKTKEAMGNGKKK